MTSSVVNPTYFNPADQSLETLLLALKREIMKEMNCAKVGVVKAYDAGAGVRAPNVNVQIAFTQVTSIAPDGTRTLAQYPLLLNVPVVFLQGGNCIHTFPIAAGDECLVIFNDRQIDNWLASGAGSPPNIGRLHDLSDGMAIVGLRSNPRPIAGISTTTSQLRSVDGLNYVELDPVNKKVNAVAVDQINLTAPVVNIVATTEVNINSPITNIQGVLNGLNTGSATNAFVINGSITTTGDVVANGISLDSHIHTGVMPGSGNTGGPTG